MVERDYQPLIDVLRSRTGDGLEFAVRFTESGSDMICGREWYEEFTEMADTRSEEKMHQDAVHKLEQATVGSQLYDNEIRSDVTITEHGTGLYVYPSEDVGYFVWFGPETSVAVPDVVDDALDAIETVE